MGLFNRKKKTESAEVVPKISSDVSVSYKSNYYSSTSTDDLVKEAHRRYSTPAGQTAVMTVFLWWCDGKSTDVPFPKYFGTKYGILNAQEYHQQVVKEGYLEPASCLVVLNSYTVAELKTLCQSVNINASGKKADIIDKLSSDMSDEAKERIASESHMYVLSKTGRDYVEANADLIQLHKCSYDISLNEYEQTKKTLLEKNPAFGFNDICWAILNKRMLQYSGRSSAGLLCNNYRHMADLLEKEGNEDKAIQYMLNVLVYDVCEFLSYDLSIPSPTIDYFEKYNAPISIEMVQRSLKSYPEFSMPPETEIIKILRQHITIIQ